MFENSSLIHNQTSGNKGQVFSSEVKEDCLDNSRANHRWAWQLSFTAISLALYYKVGSRILLNDLTSLFVTASLKIDCIGA